MSMSIPFGLYASYKGRVRIVTGIEKRYDGKWYVLTDGEMGWLIDGVKPVVRPLYHAENFKKLKGIEMLGYVSTHQDVFGLLASGDAIDVEGLAVNPYEK